MGLFHGLRGIIASPPLLDLLASPGPVRLSGELVADTLSAAVCRMGRQLFPLFSIFSSLTFYYKVLTIRIVTKPRDRAKSMLLLHRAVTWGNCAGEARVSPPKSDQFFHRLFIFRHPQCALTERSKAYEQEERSLRWHEQNTLIPNKQRLIVFQLFITIALLSFATKR